MKQIQTYLYISKENGYVVDVGWRVAPKSTIKWAAVIYSKSRQIQAVTMESLTIHILKKKH